MEKLTFIESDMIPRDVVSERKCFSYDDLKFAMYLRSIGVIGEGRYIYCTDQPDIFLETYKDYNPSVINAYQYYEDYLKTYSSCTSLNEEVVHREDSFVFNMKKNEITCHYTPHIHVNFDNFEYSISIDNNIRNLVKGTKVPKFSKIKRIIEDNLIFFRNEWNKVLAQTSIDPATGVVTKR